MNLIILAAGLGQRLWPLTKNRPKILVDLGGITLLDHQIENIRRNEAQIEKVIFVLGYRAKMVEKRLVSSQQSKKIEVIEFDGYAKCNNLMSLWQARNYMKDDFIIINGDNVFHPSALEKLISGDKEACLMIVKRDKYVDADMKVYLKEGQLKQVSKKLDNERADGISIGIMRFKADAAKRFCEKLTQFANDPNYAKEYYLRVVEALAEEIPIHTEVIPNEFWTDIDDENDLKNVRDNFQSVIEIALPEV
jgi:choline kinase